MGEILFWVYLINAMLLVNHEIDSAYWKEWDLFGLPGGITGFLLIHFPLLALILYGLVLVYQFTTAGLILSLVLSMGGVFAFTIHSYFVKRGREEFSTPISRIILVATLFVSLFQLVITLYLLVV